MHGATRILVLFAASFLCHLAAISNTASAAPAEDDATPDEEKAWKHFKEKLRKKYGSDEEAATRRRNFLKNHRLIDAHNLKHAAGKVSYTLAHNRFSDMTHEEFKQTMLDFSGKLKRPDGEAEENTENRRKKRTVVNSASSFDWRQWGYVTGVKDQGNCGSCYVFAAMAALETQLYYAGVADTLPSLGEQLPVDCMYPEKSGGCSGGWPPAVWDYLNTLHKSATSCSYPYKGTVSSECSTETAVYDIPYNIKTNYVSGAGCWYGSKDEVSLQNEVYWSGPVVVLIDASDANFAYYHSGVYTSTTCSNSTINHAVTAVGYGTDSTGKAYWIIKNSWGLGWGDQGYVYLARGKNMCAVATCCSYPTLE